MVFLFDIVMIPAALLAALAALALYRMLPAAWLCDYGESPGDIHLPARRCENRRKAVLVMWAGCLFIFRIAAPVNPEEGLLLASAFLILMTASLSDIDYRIIPDQSAGAMLLLGLAVCFVRPGTSFRCGAAGGLLVLAMMLLSSAVGWIAARKEGIGSGDIKLMAACGVCVGGAYGSEWAAGALVFYVMSILSAAGWFSVLLLLRRAGYGDGRPMAPWIASSALLCLAAAPG